MDNIEKYLQDIEESILNIRVELAARKKPLPEAADPEMIKSRELTAINPPELAKHWRKIGGR